MLFSAAGIAGNSRQPGMELAGHEVTQRSRGGWLAETWLKNAINRMRAEMDHLQRIGLVAAKSYIDSAADFFVSPWGPNPAQSLAFEVRMARRSARREYNHDQ